MRKVFYSLIIIIGIILVLYFVFLAGDPYSKVRNAEPARAQFYLSIYNKTMSDARFTTLLKRLIGENMDLKSMGATVSYISKRKMCELIPDIEAKCATLKSYPPDTVWRVQLSSSTTKQYRLNDVAIGYSMCNRLDELRKNCTASGNP